MHATHDNEIKIWDEKDQYVRKVNVKDLEDQLDRLKRLMEKVLEKLTLKDYQLANYKIGLSLKAGIFVITAEGQITLSFDRVKSS